MTFVIFVCCLSKCILFYNQIFTEKLNFWVGIQEWCVKNNVNTVKYKLKYKKETSYKLNKTQ